MDDESALTKWFSSGRARLPLFADRIALGNSKLEVSPFCVGVTDHRNAAAAAFDAGANFFFLSADLHWPLYDLTRNGLKAILRRKGVSRDDLVIAATSYVGAEHLSAGAYADLLGSCPWLERIDLVVQGAVYDNDVIHRLETSETLKQRQHMGARSHGISFHDRSAAAKAILSGRLDLSYIRYNARHLGAHRDLFPLLGPSSSDCRVFGFKSTTGYVNTRGLAKLGLSRHDWRPDVSDHYRFALSCRELDGILCSFEGPKQVDAICRAMERGPLDSEERRYLVQLAALADGKAPRRTRAPSFRTITSPTAAGPHRHPGD
jgi:hypothetical protein